MRLLGRVVVLGQGLCDDELGHVDLVLQEIGDCVLDVPVKEASQYKIK